MGILGLKSEKRLCFVAIFSTILCLLSLVNIQMAILSVILFGIFEIYLNISDGFIFLIFSSCFYNVFSTNLFLINYLVLISILLIKSTVKFKNEKWTGKSNLFKSLFVVFLTTIILLSFIASIIQKDAKYFLIALNVVLSLIVVYFCYNKINLKKLATFLGLGIVLSSLVSLLAYSTSLYTLDIYKIVGNQKCFYGLFNSAGELALVSILSIIMLTKYAIKNKKDYLSYILIFCVSLIGFLTYTPVFFISYFAIVLGLLIYIVCKGKSSKGFAKKFGLLLLFILICLALSFPYLKDMFNIFKANYQDDVLLGIFSRGHFNLIKSSVIDFFNLKANNIIFGTIFDPNISNFSIANNLLVSTLYSFGVLGVVLILSFATLIFVNLNKNSFKFINVLLMIFIAGVLLFTNQILSIGAICLMLSMAIFGDIYNTSETEKYLVGEAKNSFYLFIKRTFDITFSIIALAILIIPMSILGVIIKLTSKGPILLRLKRIGVNGKEFNLLKFRSMYEDAESRLEEYLTKEQLEMWKTEGKVDNDPRITKVGKIIRKISVDELPQLINILKGDLSFIGNRPISRLEYETYFEGDHKEAITKMRPGLTGYWQAYGRSNITYHSGKRQVMYLHYVNHASILFDIKIIFKTVISVLLRRGAK